MRPQIGLLSGDGLCVARPRSGERVSLNSSHCVSQWRIEASLGPQWQRMCCLRPAILS